MHVFLNGRFVPEKTAVVSIFDRSFLYGDGLFEGVPFFNGCPFRWRDHMDRFYTGAMLLQIRIPYTQRELEKTCRDLLRKNQMLDAFLRLTLSRGVGVRGYSPKGAGPPTLAITVHALPKFDRNNPPQWSVITSSFHIPEAGPLSRFKTCNKLPQIMARAQADAARAHEGLVLDTNGRVVEGTTSNLFWIRNRTVCTPPVHDGVLPGVTRSVVLELCRTMKIPSKEISPSPAQLSDAQGIFLTMSSFGIVNVIQLDQKNVQQSPITQSLQKSYWEQVRKECRLR